MAKQAAVALYASGRIDGVAVDCGEGMTTIVPLIEGYANAHAVMRLKLAGHEITEHLMKNLLPEKGYIFTSRTEREIVRIIKEV